MVFWYSFVKNSKVFANISKKKSSHGGCSCKPHWSHDRELKDSKWQKVSAINRQNKNCGFKFLLLSRHIHYARNWWYSNSLEELSLGNIISLSFYESRAIFIVNYMAVALIKVWHSLLFVIYVPEMFYFSMILLRTSANAKCIRVFF